MMKALYETAARISEFVNLQAEDSFYEQRRLIIRHSKRDKRREPPLTSELYCCRVHEVKT